MSNPIGGLHSSPQPKGKAISKVVRDAWEQAARVVDKNPATRLKNDVSKCVVCGQKSLLWVPDDAGIKILARVPGWCCDACLEAEKARAGQGKRRGRA